MIQMNIGKLLRTYERTYARGFRNHLYHVYHLYGLPQDASCISFAKIQNFFAISKYFNGYLCFIAQIKRKCLVNIYGSFACH